MRIHLIALLLLSAFALGWFVRPQSEPDLIVRGYPYAVPYEVPGPVVEVEKRIEVPIVQQVSVPAGCSIETRQAFDWLISSLREGQQSHQLWIDYIAAHPGYDMGPTAGTINDQRALVSMYDRRIATARTLVERCGY